MNLNEFDFSYPPELIAMQPCLRGQARLMVVHRKSKEIHHTTFSHILDFLDAGDLLVLNNTKVIPARLLGKKDTGGKVEVFLLEKMRDSSPTPQVALAQNDGKESHPERRSHLWRRREGSLWKCLVNVSIPLKCGQFIYFNVGPYEQLYSMRGSKAQPEATCGVGRAMERMNITAHVGKCSQINKDGTYLMEFEKDFPFQKLGHMPLPPYIQRKDDISDQKNYQTVFAKHEGAVAAPTAGLHWTESLLNKAKQKGIEIAEVTLHVGLGTFQPIRTENIKDHKMHSEYFEVAAEVVEKIKTARRVVCVGTTTVRVIETWGQIPPGGSDPCPAESGWTDLFITPGYTFKATDVLQTNFHQPKSSLFVLVCAFAGQDLMHKAYQEAMRHKYRLFSYGDTMLIL